MSIGMLLSDAKALADVDIFEEFQPVDELDEG
jgi:hypothetical protein